MFEHKNSPFKKVKHSCRGASVISLPHQYKKKKTEQCRSIGNDWFNKSRYARTRLLWILK
jgi:hypothetical protein